MYSPFKPPPPPHQIPSVLCTPPFEKSPIKTHRFCVLPPLKNHPSKPIGFMYSPLWKITVFDGRLFRGGCLFRQIRYDYCWSYCWKTTFWSLVAPFRRPASPVGPNLAARSVPRCPFATWSIPCTDSSHPADNPKAPPTRLVAVRTPERSDRPRVSKEAESPSNKQTKISRKIMEKIFRCQMPILEKKVAISSPNRYLFRRDLRNNETAPQPGRTSKTNTACNEFLASLYSPRKVSALPSTGSEMPLPPSYWTPVASA